MKIVITVECSSPLDAEYVDQALRNVKHNNYGQVARDMKWSRRVIRETQDEYTYLTS